MLASPPTSSPPPMAARARVCEGEREEDHKRRHFISINLAWLGDDAGGAHLEGIRRDDDNLWPGRSPCVCLWNLVVVVVVNLALFCRERERPSVVLLSSCAHEAISGNLVRRRN